MKVKAKKHLGQHFLENLNIAQDIVNALDSKLSNKVLEIGPGMGVLTQYLIAKKYNVSVVEIDKESVEYLKNNYSDKDLTIYSEDFLKMDLMSKFSEPFSIIGNFPYNISSQILFKVLESKDSVNELVGMFQKEVAERVAAKHGNKTYGILSVLIQAFYNVEYLFTVNENEFSPPPKVKSGVIRLEKKEIINSFNENALYKLVKIAFSQRRKKIRNTVKSLFTEEFIDNPIFDLRAEQISVEKFIELSQKMKQ